MSAPPVLRPLGVGELLDNAINVYRKNFVTLIGIGAVFAVVFLLLQLAAGILFSPFGGIFQGAFSPQPRGLFWSPLSLIFGSFVYWEGSAIGALLGPIAIVIEVGAFAFATSELRLGRRVTIGRAYWQALRRWISLLASAVLVQLSVLAAFILLFVPLFLLDSSPDFLVSDWLLITLVAVIPFSLPLVFLIVRWSLTTPAIVVECLGPLKGMQRSWRLTKGSFWRTWAILLGTGALVHMLTYAVWMAVELAASLLPDSLILALIVTSAGGLIAGAVIQPLAYVAVTVLYYDLRVRHEGYDLQLALDQLKQSEPAVSIEAHA